MSDNTVDVEFIKHGVRILLDYEKDSTMRKKRAHLAKTSSEHDHFVNLAHFLQEVVNSWALDDVHVMPMVLNLNRNHVVSVLDGLD